MRIYKNPAMKERAGELRGHMTPQETLLWNYCLKRLPVQIYRQYVIESYIVDGNQKTDGTVYGQSITDPCLGWEKTEKLIYEIADKII